MSAEEVQEAILAEENMTILDVRTPEEFSRSHIKNSINLPIDDLRYQITSLIPDKKQKIYVYCFSGSRSVYAVELMVKLGYTNVFDMANGLLAWRAKQYPLESSMNK